jgi:hypothetical protein
MMDRGSQIRYSYFVAVVGVALVTITAAYGLIRSFLILQMFRPRAVAGARQFGNMNPFGLMNSLTIIAVIIAIIGLVWLGLELRKSSKHATNEPSLTGA